MAPVQEAPEKQGKSDEKMNSLDWVRGLKPFTSSEDLPKPTHLGGGRFKSGEPRYEVQKTAERAEVIAVQNGGSGIQRQVAYSFKFGTAKPRGLALLKALRKQGIPGA